MTRSFSINLGDVFCGVVVIFLMYKDKPLPVIVILLCLTLAELGRIRRALTDKEVAKEGGAVGATDNEGGHHD